MSDGEPTTDNTTAATIVWDEAKRLLVRQEAMLDTLRTQAVAVLSAASIVAGLFGSHIPAGSFNSVTATVVIALCLFAGTAAVSLAILWPRAWTFSQELSERVGDLQGGRSIHAIDLATTWAAAAEKWRGENQQVINRLVCKFTWACALTGLQVIAWGCALLIHR